MRCDIKPDAIPTIWPNCPGHLTKPFPPKRLLKIQVNRVFYRRDELIMTLKAFQNFERGWRQNKSPENTLFVWNELIVVGISIADSKPDIQFNVVVKESLTFTMSVRGVELKNSDITDCLVDKLNCIIIYLCLIFHCFTPL